MVVADFVEPAAALTDGSGLDEVEVTRGVSLQVEDEFVEVLRRLEFEIEDVVAVRLAVAVRVAEFPKAVTAGDEHLAVHDLEAERMVKSGGETTPGDLGELVINAGGHEDVAVESGDHGATIGQEVEGRGEHRRLPRIGHRQADVVDHVRLAGFGGELAGRLDGLRP